MEIASQNNAGSQIYEFPLKSTNVYAYVLSPNLHSATNDH